MPRYHVCARRGAKEESWMIIEEDMPVSAVERVLNSYHDSNTADSVVVYDYTNGDLNADWDWSNRKPIMKAPAPVHEWKRGK